MGWINRMPLDDFRFIHLHRGAKVGIRASKRWGNGLQEVVHVFYLYLGGRGRCFIGQRFPRLPRSLNGLSCNEFLTPLLFDIVKVTL